VLVFFLLGSLSRLPQMIILLALPFISSRSVLILLAVQSLLNIKLFKIKMKILKIIASEHTNTFVCVCEMWSLFISVCLTYCGYYLKLLIHFFAFVCSRPYFDSELCVIFLCGLTVPFKSSLYMTFVCMLSHRPKIGVNVLLFISQVSKNYSIFNYSHSLVWRVILLHFLI